MPRRSQNLNEYFIVLSKPRLLHFGLFFIVYTAAREERPAVSCSLIAPLRLFAENGDLRAPACVRVVRDYCIKESQRLQKANLYLFLGKKKNVKRNQPLQLADGNGVRASVTLSWHA